MKIMEIYKDDFHVVVQCHIHLLGWFKIYIKNNINDDFVIIELSNVTYIFEDMENHYFVSSTAKNTLSMRKFIKNNILYIFKQFQNERIKYYYGL